MEIYVRIYKTRRQADYYMHSFLEVLNEKGVEYKVFSNQMIVIAEHKETHFITEYEYDKWNRGRTYYLEGKKYRSGYPIESNTLMSAT